MKCYCLNTILFLLVAFSFVKCKTENPYKTIIKEYVKSSDSTYKSKFSDSLYYNNKSYLVTLMYKQKPVISKISGYLVGKPYGHHFKFDVYGTLEEYKFNVDDNHYSYNVSYSNDSTKYLEVGSSFVDFWKDESKGTDSLLKLICFFSKFPRQEIKVFISTDGIHYNNSDSKKSMVMPFLEEVDLSLPSGIKKVFFKIETDNLIYEWKGLLKKKGFLDSLSL